ncbi:cyclopropane-fatty-acyl-phospholipid synthase [Candidatus Uhrbacteria bacterium CG10_big_fil_rev_8_21_14_0_10_50_16]|uniref:Cyclopropane-fatty-acyl-phospholipid synthase n=1 Tax=Candidatus Uhrbacteria bacterium CG10_big_fil_rev_8_21_14_0_10_50_16 TaxID=1975039 RepID=A0A2H0RQ66_9BACT|nr:MAG: cyclopropane-fatty-acyl-phospholipid synthase [Candidatus Uhrbacteria bacterium CG10_big_fil_rev_8_21_14_0_10_50_16]
MTTQERIQSLLEGTDIVLNGEHLWDPQIKQEGFYRRVLTRANLGLGEAYMDGWWECAQIDEFIARLMRIDIRTRLKRDWPTVAIAVASVLMNRQTSKRAFTVGEVHYDAGNDLYQDMLDKRMVYTCGYWKNAHNLDEAQEAKLDLVCKKIGLKAGDKVLDIGCGWGSFAKYAAETYGAHVVGVTVSKEQKALADKRCAGLPVEIRLQDYREINEPFDHIVSLGMIEHVGYKNYRAYMEVAAKNLREGGMFLLHTIGSLKSAISTDPWIEKYIFPNSMLPSLAQLAKAVEGLFVVEDVQNFGADYDKTLMAWFENFDAAWPHIKDQYDERFYRMWKYYLLSCAGSFRSRDNQLWQLVLSKGGVEGVYEAVR